MIGRVIDYARQFLRDVGVPGVGSFVAALGFAAAIPLLSIYFHTRLGLSITEIGLFFGVMALVRAVFQVVGLTWFGRRLPARFNRK